MRCRGDQGEAALDPEGTDAAGGYRHEANVITMIYLIGSPVGRLFDQAKST
ncbi:hypothetical protein [Halomonas sp.]|uniref:hypothetical protein n=1 Tax=Halomonas sp. TaxID=1486246 RepID=UPI00384BF3FE